MHKLLNEPTKQLGCRNLTLAVGQKTLIKGVSLDIPISGITCILGFNGAGKTLLLRLLHGLLAPTSGTITLDGSAATAEDFSRQAMVFQKPVMMRRTVLANAKFALKFAKAKSRVTPEKLLTNAGLLHLSAQAARKLSGGEQQRLALAMALASEPDILFLDEATASLDPASTRAIENIIAASQLAGTKIIMVTHDLAQARRLAHHVIYLHQGEVMENRPADAFFNAPETYSAKAFVSGEIPKMEP